MTKRSPSVPAKKIDAAELMRWIDEIEQRALEAVADVQDPDRLATQTAIYLGRGGELNGALEHLTDLTKAERAEVGRRANQVKTNLEAEYGRRREEIRASLVQSQLQQEALDVTLPGRPLMRGRIHPANQGLRLIIHIWAEMGFQVYRSREGARCHLAGAPANARSNPSCQPRAAPDHPYLGRNGVSGVSLAGGRDG